MEWNLSLHKQIMPLINNASAVQDKLVGFVILQSSYSVKIRKMQIIIQDFSWINEIICLKGPLCGRRGGEIEFLSKNVRRRWRRGGEGILSPYHIQPRNTQEKCRTQTKGWCFSSSPCRLLTCISSGWGWDEDEVDVCLWKFPSDLIF